MKKVIRINIPAIVGVAVAFILISVRDNHFKKCF